MSDIEWTDETWNPTDGCKVCSPGCANCYAMRFAGRFAKPGERYHGLVTIGKNKRAIWTGKGRLDAGKLAKPLHWKRPRRVFVNSMSDLFYEEFTNEEIAAVFGVMAACPRHTFQILTKRAKRMREWFAWAEQHGDKQDLMRFGPSALLTCAWEACSGDIWGDGDDPFDGDLPTAERFGTAWPLPNVHLGVSAENQEAFDERWPHLLNCPAAVWWFSAEPLLGGIDMTHMLADFACKRGKLWLVAGCESGPGARPCASAWLQALRDQCSESNVPFFLKQAHPWTWATGGKSPGHKNDPGDAVIAFGPGSKRKAGGVIGLPYLDGVQHKAFPNTKEMTL